VLGLLLLLAGVALCVVPQGPAGAASCTVTPCRVDFANTGDVRTWRVPSGITAVTITAAGGSGGGTRGGAGGRVTAVIPVHGGTSLSILAGAAGAAGQPSTRTRAAAAGGFGGGGPAGSATGPVAHPGSGGGGGSFVYRTSSGASEPLVIAGGGGGAPGGSGYPSATGGDGGSGGDAPATVLALDPLSGAAGTVRSVGAGGRSTLAAGRGQAGSGPGSGPDVLASIGAGGSGADGIDPGPLGTAGGGGGGFRGGGGGATDATGASTGVGGGGSGYVVPRAAVLARSTNSGDGWVSILYAHSPTITSGTLLSAETGLPVPHSCVFFSPVSDPSRTFFNRIGADGRWSLVTLEHGPFNLGFYTTATGDCGQPILPRPAPAWYVARPLSGTDVGAVRPPAGVTTVRAGRTGILACLDTAAVPAASASHCAPAAGTTGTPSASNPPVSPVAFEVEAAATTAAGPAGSASAGTAAATGVLAATGPDSNRTTQFGLAIIAVGAAVTLSSAVRRPGSRRRTAIRPVESDETRRSPRHRRAGTARHARRPRHR
jgi:hypothetical protein